MALRRIDLPLRYLLSHGHMYSGWLISLFVLLASPVLLRGQDVTEDPKAWQIEGAWSALQDPQRGVQRRAIQKLVELKAFSHSSKKADYPRLRQCVLALQQSTEYRDQAVAAQAMGYKTKGLPDNAVELLAQLAEDDLDEPAVAALGRLARVSESARQKLEELALQSRSGDAMIEAAVVLNGLDPTSPIPASTLTYLVAKGGEDWEASAAESLGKLQLTIDQKAAAVAALTGLLKKESLDHYDQARVARAIVRLDLDSAEARRKLTDLSTNEDVASNVREEAAAALIRWFPDARDAALATILQMIKSQDVYLVNLHDLAENSPAFIAATVRMTEDDDQEVRRQAFDALSRWAGSTIAPDMVAPRLTQMVNNKAYEPYERTAAIEALGRIGPRLDDARFIVSTLNELIRDPAPAKRPHHTANLRATAAAVLLQLAPDASNKQELLQLLAVVTRDKSTKGHLAAAPAFQLLDDDSQHAIVTRLIQDVIKEDSFEDDSRTALAGFGPLGIRSVLAILAGVYQRRDFAGELRFLAYLNGGGNDNINQLVRCLGVADPASEANPAVASRQMRMDFLAACADAWDNAQDFPSLQEDMAKHVTRVIRQGGWSGDRDIAFLDTWQARLQDDGFEDRQLVVADMIARLRGPGPLGSPSRWVIALAGTLLLHLCFWLALIAAYPRSRHVQAIFFWNSRVRRIVGFAYVGWLLAWVPPLRRILFAPFRETLLADAAIDELDRAKYFTDLEVRDDTGGKVLPIETAIPDLRGRVLLEGESGLGKSMFARRLAQRSKRIVVFLLAEKCSRGVIRAIQDKLHGPAMDKGYLSTLIYSGCIDVVIDGLNEVDPDTRARIGNFVEKNANGNVVLTSQPMAWKPPAGMRRFVMQPLKESAIEEFLHTQMDADLSTHARLQFKQRTTNYLVQSLAPNQPPDALDGNRRILSNPMDLTLVANLIADGQEPDLFRLQEQQFEVMAAEYARTHVGTRFPEEFAEAVYRMRREGRSEVPAETFAVELSCMQRYKMVVLRHATDAAGHSAARWYFRHDKIMDFFIVQTFLQHANRLEQHLNDSRFRGVYFLLATLLPFEKAMQLRERLVQQAAKTNDTSLLRPFVELVNTRKAA